MEKTESRGRLTEKMAAPGWGRDKYCHPAQISDFSGALVAVRPFLIIIQGVESIYGYYWAENESLSLVGSAWQECCRGCQGRETNARISVVLEKRRAGWVYADGWFRRRVLPSIFHPNPSKATHLLSTQTTMLVSAVCKGY